MSMKKTDSDNHQRPLLFDVDLDYPLSAKVNAIPDALFDPEDLYARGRVLHDEVRLSR